MSVDRTRSDSRAPRAVPSSENWLYRDLVLLHKIAVKANQTAYSRETLAYVLEQICRHQNWTVGHVFLLRSQPNLRYYPVDSLWICAEEPARFRRLRTLTLASSFAPGEGMVGSVGQSDGPVWISNTATASPPLRFTDSELEVRSALLIPVPVRGQSTAEAVVELFAAERRRMSPARLRLASGVGSLLGTVFEREQVERRLAESREKEQQRLGRELHDTISQDLTGITLMAERLNEKLDEADSPLADRMHALVKHVSDVRTKVHALSRGLLPVEIESNGLEQALDNLAAKTNEIHGLDCSVRCPETVDVGDGVVANQLARIAQEAIQNTVKHAKAEKVELSLVQRGPRVTMTVTDDGVGFSSGDRRGVGLQLMRHRAAAIGAQLTVVSRPGKGTRVRCDWRA